MEGRWDASSRGTKRTRKEGSSKTKVEKGRGFKGGIPGPNMMGGAKKMCYQSFLTWEQIAETVGWGRRIRETDEKKLLGIGRFKSRNTLQCGRGDGSGGRGGTEGARTIFGVCDA